MEQWAILYELAVELWELQPWRRMYDTNVFGVQHPKTGQIGYCCVLGRMGEFFGLACYIGPEGLWALHRAFTRPSEPRREVVPWINGVVLNYAEKSRLQPEDLGVIRRLGLDLRGQKRWPEFRSYRPHYWPWFLSKGDAVFFAPVLEQAIRVGELFERDETCVPSWGPGSLIPVRVPKTHGGTIQWEWGWVEQKRVDPSTILKRKEVNPFLLRKVELTARRIESVWEMDYVHSPDPFRENDERPYFARLFMCIDATVDQIVGQELLKANQDVSELAGFLLKKFDELGAYPSHIVVKRADTAAAMKPIAKALKIHLRRSKNLAAFDHAMKGLLFFLSRNRNKP